MTTPKQSRHATPVATTSAPLTPERLDALRDLIPEAFGETGIDWDKLKTVLGETVDDRPDRYRFEWAGKRDAIALLQRPSSATLVPVPDESINFDTTRHVFIEGENLEVLKLLYKPYAGRVKMIYIDPPYNTGNDFIYRDDYSRPLQAYLEQTGQAEAAPADARGAAERASRTGRIHSDWLNMMYPRLFLARQLLRDDGVIFISCDDNEVHHLRVLMNELFGEENFVATVVWQKVFAPKNTARQFSSDHDYVLLYARNSVAWGPSLLPRGEAAEQRYKNPDDDPRGPWSSSDLTARNYYSEGTYEVVSPSGKAFGPAKGTYWRVNRGRFDDLNRDGRIWWGERGDNMPRLKRFLSEVKTGVVPQTLWLHTEVGNTQEAKKELLDFVAFQETDNVLDTVKPTRLIRRMLQVATTPAAGDIVLDFFVGSGTTPHAVLEQNATDGGNRRCISVQFPERLPVPEPQLRTIADTARARVREALRRFENADEPLGRDLSARPADLGMAVFRLSRGSIRPWEASGDSPEAYSTLLALQLDPVDRKAEAVNLIHEVALKEAGMSLSARLKKIEGITTNTVFGVTDPDDGRHFHICLDDRLHPDTPKALGLKGDADLFVCRDVALDDTLAANLALQCRLRTL